MFHVRHLSTIRHALPMNSFQQRCLIHTCVPLMNQNKPGQFDEQPHMRVQAQAAAENKGISIVKFALSFILIS